MMHAHTTQLQGCDIQLLPCSGVVAQGGGREAEQAIVYNVPRPVRLSVSRSSLVSFSPFFSGTARDTLYTR